MIGHVNNISHYDTESHCHKFGTLTDLILLTYYIDYIYAHTKANYQTTKFFRIVYSYSLTFSSLASQPSQ